MKTRPFLLLAIAGVLVVATAASNAAEAEHPTSIGCDFDGDGYDDLAVGVPYDEVDGKSSAGSVHVIHGTADGLSAVDDQVWHREKDGVNAQAGYGDLFGFSITCGDYNGDGYSDLTVGVPSEDLNAIWNAGAVNVTYGDIVGLTSDGNQFWSRNSPGIIGNADYDTFGRSLAP